MTEGRIEIGSAVASPTKEFFVKMLTRDIELHDALLDLLDNCVDGILRSDSRGSDDDKPYKDFEATFIFEPDYFSIEDNCGGIPKDVAEHYAFAMGKPPQAIKDTHAATVGMYGIGMKRAIFKIGSEALVESLNDQGFIVEFSNQWMNSDDWGPLPMFELPPGRIAERSTRIEVFHLNDDVQAAFSDSSWIEEFRKVVSRHYSIIIAKGFSIYIGTREEIARGQPAIPADEFRLITSPDSLDSGIAPYIYTGKIGEVEIEIYAGIYRKLLTEDQLESEENAKASSDDAGWTVACNDRIVVWKDKTRLTGWGEATVPNYHGQFIAITGIVLLRSLDPRLLPLTTTKRGLDGGSLLYSEVKDLMREATKSLTTFTNRWKKFPSQLDSLYKATQYADLKMLRAMPQKVEMRTLRKLKGVARFEPNYPRPVEETSSVRVSFVALKSDVVTLRKYYFDDADVKPSEVGEAAFNMALQVVELAKK